MEMQLVLATVLQQYQLDLVPGFPIVPQPGITLRQKYGLPMFLRPISSSDGAGSARVESTVESPAAVGVVAAGSPSLN
jgi:hypothetical protein